MTPGAVFEIHLRNPGSAAHSGNLVFNFPGFNPHDAAAGKGVQREALSGPLNGVRVRSNSRGDAWEMEYVLAALDAGAPVQHGGALNADKEAWSRIGDRLPTPSEDDSGAALAIPFDLAPGAAQTVRVVLAWHAPHWRAGGSPAHEETPLFTHMYARHHPDALSTANFLAGNHETLLQRVIAWQEVLYNAPELPGWLADALLNNLHLVPECSIWGQAQPPLGDWCAPEDGLFGLNECPRGCPQIECLPCSFYGNIPLVYFFPEAALSTLRGYKAYQFPDGRPPWIFGGITATNEANRPGYGLSAPDVGYQTVLNGACYVIMLDRYWQTSGDDAVLAEFWDSLKRCNDFSMNLRPAYGPSQVMAMPAPGTDSHGLGDTEWFEAPEPGWKGYVTHAGGVRMAQVQIMRRMAAAMEDDAYLARCDNWLAAGAQALEEHLWAGEYYLNFNEPETGQKSDLVFGYQLDGQWVTDWHGVNGVFPAAARRENVADACRRQLRAQPVGRGQLRHRRRRPGQGRRLRHLQLLPARALHAGNDLHVQRAAGVRPRPAAALPAQHHLPLGLHLGRAQHCARRRRHRPARLRRRLLPEHDALGRPRRPPKPGPDRPDAGRRPGGTRHRGGTMTAVLRFQFLVFSEASSSLSKL